MIGIKRIYDPPKKEDGFRILLDRLWPRGLSKEKARVDLWLRDIAPSDSLRKWFSHDPKKWKDFKNRYKGELVEKRKMLDQIKEFEKENKVVTFLYAAKNQRYNNAVVLMEILRLK
jgi:uncharacterized protein YeaO (DUF488 family)